MWMFVLDRLGRVSKDGRWDVFVVEFGEVIYLRFIVYKFFGGMRLVGRISGDMEDVVDVERGDVDVVIGWVVF